MLLSSFCCSNTWSTLWSPRFGSSQGMLFGPHLFSLQLKMWKFSLSSWLSQLRLFCHLLALMVSSFEPWQPEL